MKLEGENLNEPQNPQLNIGDVSGSADVEIYIIDPNTVNYNPYEDRC